MSCLADVVVLGAHVLTMDAARPEVSAFAARSGTIVAVGDDATIRACVGPKTLVHRLAGATVLPGFVDAHNHPGESGIELGEADVSAAPSVDAVVTTARAWRDAHPGAAWVEGGGWDTTTFPDAAPLAALDAAFGAQPVYLASADGHSGWANSAALRAAGLLTGPDPRGGQVVRAADGVPTGVVRETATDVVAGAAPDPDRATVDAGLAAALGELARYGITSTIEAASDRTLLAGWRRAERAGRLTARIFAAVPVDPGEGPAAVRKVAALARRYHSDRLAVTAIKLFFDGVVETETARLLAPYADGTNGEVQFTDAELDALFDAADRAGLQVHGHTIGDGAVRQALDAETRLVARRGAKDRRMILAHLEMIDPADAPRFAQLGAIADLQPLWAYPDPYVETGTRPILGNARTARLYPFGDLVRAGAPLAAGSDWSVTTLNPWPAIEVALTRQDPDAPGAVLGPDQALDLDTLLHAYTTGGAHAVGADGRLGVIREGAQADFVVLDRDPTRIPPADLSAVQVAETWVGGACVYTSKTGN